MKQRNTVIFCTYHSLIPIPFFSLLFILVPILCQLYLLMYLFLLYVVLRTFFALFLYLICLCTYFIPVVPTYIVRTAISSSLVRTLLSFRTYFSYALYLLLTPFTFNVLTAFVADPIPYSVYPRVHTYFKFSVVLVVVPFCQKRCPSDLPRSLLPSIATLSHSRS
jgi:hypothetical protein